MLCSVATGVFTAPTMANFLTLARGWLFCREPRTTSAMLLAAGALSPKHFSCYHRLFSTAAWSSRALRLGLLKLLVRTLCPRGELILVGDDTVRSKTGRKIAGAAFWHNHCATRRQQRKTVWGHSWVMLALAVKLAGKTYCVPVGIRLYRTRADCRRCRAAHVSRGRMLMEMVRDLRAVAGDRSILLLVDGQYACTDVIRSLPRRVSVITRVRHDAALWAPPPRPRHRNVGRPRTRAGRLPTPRHMAADPQRPWRLTPQGRQVKSCQALWYRVNKRRVNKIVLIKGPSGPKKFSCLLCTDAKRDAEQIVSLYAARWRIEIAIRDAKQQGGLAQGQCRTVRAVQRQATFTVTMMGAVMGWYLSEGHRTDRLARRPWYRRKTHPSFRDMMVHARRQSWRRTVFDGSAPGVQTQQIPLRFLDLLELAA
jgi:hypothetical protein